jgi:putative ABC transport system permease protein
MGEGVNPEKERVVSPTLLISAGQNLAPEDTRGILLGRGLAENLGAQVGDQVVLLANTPSGGLAAVEAKVRGLFSTVSKAYDDSALRVPLPIAQKLLRAQGIHRSILVLDDTAKTSEVLTVLRAPGSETGLTWPSSPGTTWRTSTTRWCYSLSKQVMVVELIIAAVIVLGISNTMTMNVLERTAEIGTCLAIGRRRRRSCASFSMKD